MSLPNKNILIKLTKFTLPILLMSLIGAIGGFISMNLIGRLGQPELAAGALIYSIYGFIFAISLSFLLPVSIYAGKECGSRNLENVGLVVKDGLMLATLFGALATLATCDLGPLLTKLGQPAIIVEYTAQYFHVMAFGMIPFMWMLVINQFLLGISRPNLMLVLTVANLPINIFLTYGLLFGKFGLPECGIVGSAYASVASILINLVMFILMAFTKQNIRRYLASALQFKASIYVKRLFNIGWPIAIQRGAEIAAFTAITFLIGRLPDALTALSAQQIVLQYTMLIVLISFSLMQSVGIFVGRSLGANNFKDAKAYGYASILLGVGCMTVAFLFFWLLPKPFIALFVDVNNPDNLEVVTLGASLLFIAGVTQIFDAIRNIIAGALRGFQDTQMPMIINVVCCWGVGVPLAYISAFWFNWGAIGISSGFAAGIACSAVLMLFRFRSFFNKPSMQTKPAWQEG